MGGRNRGRLTVDLHGAWRLYTLTIPPGSHALGTVSRSVGKGALVRTAVGELVQVNAGAITTLDQRKAEEALRQANGDTDA